MTIVDCRCTICGALVFYAHHKCPPKYVVWGADGMTFNDAMESKSCQLYADSAKDAAMAYRASNSEDYDSPTRIEVYVLDENKANEICENDDLTIEQENEAAVKAATLFVVQRELVPSYDAWEKKLEEE
jgi:hypothetical protein